MKRLAIYFFYDKDGVGREYNYFFVESLCHVASYIHIVVNGKLTDDSRCRFQSISDAVQERENTGFDVWAYKEAMEAIGADKLKDYDELILCNFTCYGPVYPFEEMFAQMEKRDCSFWGVTKHPEQKNFLLPNKEGWIYEHLMSHFIVIRRDMFTSGAFRYYWDTMRPIRTKVESTAYHETQFTKYFEDIGYKSDSYIDLKDYKGRVNNYTIFLPDELLLKSRCPLVKRRAFFFPLYDDILDVSTGHHSARLLEYIREHTTYEVDMIWDDLLATQNISDIITQLHLNYIINDDSKLIEDKPTAVFITVRELFQWTVLKKYLSKLNSSTKVFLLVNNEILEPIRTDEFTTDVQYSIISSNNGAIYGDIRESGIDYSGFDYICCIDAAHVVTKLQLTQEDYYDSICENLLYSQNYVNNIISKFDNDNRLGLFLPFPSSAAIHYSNVTIKELLRYGYVKHRLQRFLPDLRIDQKLLTTETAFWCTGKVFDKICSIYKDIPAEQSKEFIAYLYPSIAQSAGYYSAYVQSEFQSRINATNALFASRSIIADVYSRIRPLDWSLRGLRNIISKHCSHLQFPLSSQQKLHFRDVKRIIKEYVKQKLRRKKDKKAPGRRYTGNAILRYIGMSGDRVLLHVLARKSDALYMQCGIRRFYPKQEVSDIQEELQKYYLNYNTDGFFFELPLEYVKNEPIYVKVNENDFCKLAWTGDISYGAFELKKLGYYTRISKGKKILIEDRRHYQASTLFSPEYSLKDKLLWLMMKLNPIHKYILFTENGGAGDNCFELFKYAVERNSNCYFLASKSVIDGLDDGYLKKHTVEFNSMRHLIKFLFSKIWVTSFSLRYELFYQKKTLKDIHYYNIPAEWVFVPHGITADKTSVMVSKYSWDEPSRTFCCSPCELPLFNEYGFRNIAALGAPRMDKWFGAQLDDQKIVLFFTWRFAMRAAKPIEMKNSSYVSNVVRVVEMIKTKFPQRQIYYVFHHEVVRSGLDKIIQEALSAYDLTYICFNSVEGIQKFNTQFKSAKYLITDYSSVAYDFAYKQGAIPIYYIEESFIRGHYPLKQKFYDIHLGVLAFSISQMEEALAMKDPTDEMERRKKAFFVYQDANNCERVYNAIFNEK